MKKIKLFENFIYEGVQFNKKGVKQKIEASIEHCEQELAAGKKWMQRNIDALKKVNPNKLNFRTHTRLYAPKAHVPGTFEIFDPRSAKALAAEIAKVIKKYKGEEVETSDIPAAAGWSGTMRATVSGNIKPRVNFNNGSESYIIAVTIGSGIDKFTHDEMMQDLYELFFHFEEFNSDNGGMSFGYSYGTNYSTIGIESRRLMYSKGFAESLLKIMNS